MELINHTEDIQCVETWLRETAYEVKGAVMLIVGTPGCGASTLLTTLLQKQHIEPVWFTPGTPKLRASLKDAGISSVSASGNRKILVLEGFDCLMTDANAAADISDFIGKWLPAPVVFLGHRSRTVFKRFGELFKAATRHRSTVLELKPLTLEAVVGVVQQQFPTMSRETATALATAARGDVRAALAAAAFSTTTPETSVKDTVYESYSVVDMTFDGDVHSIQDALTVASGDPTVVSLGLFESYGLDPDIAEAFSIADVMEEFMFARQRWDLSDVHAAMAVAYPALHVSHNASKNTTVKRSKESQQKFSYGMVWSRAHLQASKARLLKTVGAQRADAGFTTFLTIQDLAWIRTMVMTAESQKDPTSMKAVVGGLKPSGVLAIMRLWKGKYTQSTHARVVKMLAQ